MFRIIFVTSILVAWGDCKIFILSGPTWKNQMKACAWDGEYHTTYKFNLGALAEVNVEYGDIDSKTTAIAEGDLQLKTGKEGWVPRSELHLSQFSESSDYKQFRGKWNMESSRGWGSQSVEMVLTLRFYDTGKIYLESYVSAGSWYSVTCAQTRAFVERIKIATEDPIVPEPRF